MGLGHGQGVTVNLTAHVSMNPLPTGTPWCLLTQLPPVRDTLQADGQPPLLLGSPGDASCPDFTRTAPPRYRLIDIPPLGGRLHRPALSPACGLSWQVLPFCVHWKAQGNHTTCLQSGLWDLWPLACQGKNGGGTGGPISSPQEQDLVSPRLLRPQNSLSYLLDSEGSSEPFNTAR